MKTDFARESAIKILDEIENKDAYSNIALDEYINKNREKLKKEDIAFLSELVYGVTMWKITLDEIIQMHSNIKLKKISKWVKNILRIGIYQIVFLDKVPNSAAVNESVNLAKKYASKSTGFVNAILRKVTKKDYEEILNIKDFKQKISKAYSMPLWIVEKLSNEYEKNQVEEICKNSTLKPKTTIRINTLKTSKEEFIDKLQERKILYQETNMEDFLQVKMQNISQIDLFKEGYFIIQDMSAGLASYILNSKEGQTVLDACSAPGGKTTYIAQIMNNKGKIIALDIYKKRLELVQQNAKRLGISIIQTNLQDASIYKEEYKEKFDKILLDVPCMGLGVIKRKPDIKWKKKQAEVENINKLQKQILDVCSKYLKKGGSLVYSTCSILREENQGIIQQFIEKHTEYEKEKEITILPNEMQDGFYICKLIKM